MRSLDSPAATKLEGTTAAVGPFWSPDGKSVAFFAGGKLQAIDVGGGAVRTICSVSSGATYAGSWSAESTIIFAELARDGGLFAVPANGGTPRKLPPGPGLYGHHFPRRRWWRCRGDRRSCCAGSTATAARPPAARPRTTFRSASHPTAAESWPR